MKPSSGTRPGSGLVRPGPLALDAKTASLLQLAVSVAIGSPGVCVEWSITRALAAGATDDEIADVLLVIAPVTGLGRVVCAAPDVATALGYDIAAALEEPDGHDGFTSCSWSVPRHRTENPTFMPIA